MKLLSRQEWTYRLEAHQALVSPMADSFLERRGLGQKHPIYDFLFTYYPFSPAKLKQWIPSFEEILDLDGEETPSWFSEYWFEIHENRLRLNLERLQPAMVSISTFIQELCEAVLERAPRFGCFGLHEWAMVYRLSDEKRRHGEYPLRLSSNEIVSFVEGQNLCCTHYDAYRFFTLEAKPLNLFKPTLENRIQNEQAGCLHANMDLYKWATKLWPWVGSDLIAKTFLLAVEGRELDMRASPYDLEAQGYSPIRIETEEGRREYQLLQQRYSQKSLSLRQELAAFCSRLLSHERSTISR